MEPTEATPLIPDQPSAAPAPPGNAPAPIGNAPAPPGNAPAPIGNAPAPADAGAPVRHRVSPAAAKITRGIAGVIAATGVFAAGLGAAGLSGWLDVGDAGLPLLLLGACLVFVGGLIAALFELVTGCAEWRACWDVGGGV